MPVRSKPQCSKEGYERVADDDSEAVLLEEMEEMEELKELPEDCDAQTEIERLQEEIDRCADEQKRLEADVESLNGFWLPRSNDLQKKIKASITRRCLSEEKVEQLEAVDEDGDEVVKPSALSFVRTQRFSATCSFVVVINLVTMFMEMAHPHYKRDFWLLDQLILIFYIVELSLKACVHQRELLFGKLSVVWWNWLDLIIVFAAMLDQWVQPLIISAEPGDNAGSSHSSAAQLIKCLRILRLARILKTVRAFMQSDLSWTEGKNFQLFIMGTIAANSIIMSFESDYPDFAGWFYVEQGLLMIFSFELLVRLRFSGCRFFYHPTDFAWNWLDLTIVGGGIVDEWMMPMLTLVQKMMGAEHTAKLDVGEIMTTLRMARLLRILRLVRLVKNVPPLFTLIVGIMQAMQGMAWVLVLTAVFLYAFALLGVRLIGHGLLFGGRAPPDVAAIFPSVPQSMFVLFKVMNGDTDSVEPLFEALPLSKLVCVLYMVVSSWAILSILTAVVSENMINATDAHRLEVDSEQHETNERLEIQFLTDALMRADKNGDGDLGWTDFNALLEDEHISGMLTEITGSTKEDLREVYTHLRTGDAAVKRDDFIKAVRTEKRSVTERWMYRLEKKLINLQCAFDVELGHMKASSSGQTSMDPRSLEAMLEPLFSRFDERLERRTREMADLLAANLLKERCQVVDKAAPSCPDLPRSSSSTIASSLARIEEQVDMNTKLLDRSRTECVIMACLAKLEKQNVDVKKLLYESNGDDASMKQALARIEERLQDGCVEERDTARNIQPRNTLQTQKPLQQVQTHATQWTAPHSSDDRGRAAEQTSLSGIGFGVSHPELPQRPAWFSEDQEAARSNGAMAFEARQSMQEGASHAGVTTLGEGVFSTAKFGDGC